jgi:hypothetical protein
MGDTMSYLAGFQGIFFLGMIIFVPIRLWQKRKK